MDRRGFLKAAGSTLVALRSDGLARVQAASQAAAGRDPGELAGDEDFWFDIRHAFTIDRNHINLNNGSVSPAPRVVQEAMNNYLTVTNMSPSLYVDEMLEHHKEGIRIRLAGLFGCDPEELALTRNTSESMEIVQLGLDLQPGDEVLTTTQDYPRMLTTWRRRERREGIVLKTFPFPVPPSGWDDLYERFAQAITPRTKAVLMCHTTYTTGQIFPVKRICEMARARGIESIVDGAHGFAQFPFTRDDLGCDYYGTSLHKWLTAPVGSGFLYVRREKIRGLWPMMSAPESLDDDIRKFEEIGTHPVAIRNAVREAITFHESIGVERKAARLRYLRDRWARRVEGVAGVNVLTPLDDIQSCGVAAMSIDGIGAQALTDWLQVTHDVHVRPRFVPGEFDCIRVTPNVYSTLDDVDTFAAAIEQVARTGV